MISGEGFYLWNLTDCEGGDLTLIRKAAKAAGLKHVLVKIQDGVYSFNLDKTAADPEWRLTAVISALQTAGIEVWGWVYVYGEYPNREAIKTIERVKALGLTGVVVNAEVEYKNRSSQAVTYMNALRAGLPGVPLGLSSYRFPSLHREFPWTEFISRVDVVIPQVYWVLSNNPGAQLKRCVDEYRKFPIRPLIPTGSAYKDNQNVDPRTGEYWRPSAEQVRKFMDTADELGLRGCNFWEWANCRKYCPDLWDVIAEHGGAEVAEEEEGEPEVNLSVEQLRPTGEVNTWLNVRTAPGVINQAVEKILPGETVCVLEERTMPDGNVWVRIGHRQWAARLHRQDGRLVEYLK